MGRAGAFLTALPMTPLDRGILDDILANPDNDALRLIAADFWEDQGEVDRAEFIRVQVTLEGMTEDFCPCDPKGHLPGSVGSTIRVCTCRWCGLRRREQALLTHGDWWANNEFGVIGSGPWLQVDAVVWRHGFVHGISLTAQDWLAHADAIRARQPVQAVTLTTWPECSQPHGFRNPCRRFDETALIFPWCDACRLTTEESRTKRWPGVTFTLPPQEQSVAEMPANVEDVYDVYDVMTRLEQARLDRLILEGDPAAARPLGILNAPKRKQPALPDPRPPKPRR